MAHFNFVCDFIVPLKWRQNQWWRLRPRTRWFVDPREECLVLPGSWLPWLTPRWSSTKQNMAFLPRTDRSSCPRFELSEPQSSHSVACSVWDSLYTRRNYQVASQGNFQFQWKGVGCRKWMSVKNEWRSYDVVQFFLLEFWRFLSWSSSEGKIFFIINFSHGPSW